jgi:hypothetical protein
MDNRIAAMSLVPKRIVWGDGSSRPDDFNIVHEACELRDSVG